MHRKCMQHPPPPPEWPFMSWKGNLNVVTVTWADSFLFLLQMIAEIKWNI